MFKQKVAVAQKTILRGKKIDVAQKVISVICCRRKQVAVAQDYTAQKRKEKLCSTKLFSFWNGAP